MYTVHAHSVHCVDTLCGFVHRVYICTWPHTHAHTHTFFRVEGDTDRVCVCVCVHRPALPAERAWKQQAQPHPAVGSTRCPHRLRGRHAESLEGRAHQVCNTVSVKINVDSHRRQLLSRQEATGHSDGSKRGSKQRGERKAFLCSPGTECPAATAEETASAALAPGNSASDSHDRQWVRGRVRGQVRCCGMRPLHSLKAPPHEKCTDSERQSWRFPGKSPARSCLGPVTQADLSGDGHQTSCVSR